VALAMRDREGRKAAQQHFGHPELEARGTSDRGVDCARISANHAASTLAV
jgi:hypothetical protein